MRPHRPRNLLPSPASTVPGPFDTACESFPETLGRLDRSASARPCSLHGGARNLRTVHRLSLCCRTECPGPWSARPIEAAVGSAQCEDYRVIQFLVVLDVRELVQHDHVQSLPANGVGIVWQSLYHRPVPKREPPLPRRTLEHLPSQLWQESGDFVYHLQALPLARSNNSSSE